MIASLPMYDWPEAQSANDRLWLAIADGLRARGINAPAALTRDDDLWGQWEAPDLVLSQTCGLPYRARLLGKVRLVGSPDYGLDGCPPGYYASKIVVRKADADVAPDDWSKLRLVYNEDRSQSGWASILNHAAALGASFASAQGSGGHRNSVQMVADGAADIGAIDAQSWRLAQAYDPWAEQLAVIGQTEPTPATPFITAGDASDERVALIRAALDEGVAAMSDDDRAVLHLRGVADVPHDAYIAVPTPVV